MNKYPVTLPGGNGGNGGSGGNASGGGIDVAIGTLATAGGNGASTILGTVEAGNGGAGGAAGPAGVIVGPGKLRSPTPGKTGANGTATAPDDNDTPGTINVTATEFIFSPLPTLVTPSSDPYPVYVLAEDASGDIDPAFNGDVTLSLGSNPGDAALTASAQDTAGDGVVEVTAYDGVAEFTGLSVTEPELGYTLKATAVGLVAHQLGQLQCRCAVPVERLGVRRQLEQPKQLA